VILIRKIPNFAREKLIEASMTTARDVELGGKASGCLRLRLFQNLVKSFASGIFID
jgi:hypothetical protein